MCREVAPTLLTAALQAGEKRVGAACDAGSGHLLPVPQAVQGTMQRDFASV